MKQIKAYLFVIALSFAASLFVMAKLLSNPGVSSMFGLVAALLAPTSGLVIALLLGFKINKELRQISQTLTGGSNATRSAYERLSTNCQAQVLSAREQSSALQGATESLQAICAAVKHTSVDSDAARQLAEETRNTADVGAKEMDEMCAAMVFLKSASGDFKHITKSIEEISRQANILALNAALEAARTGESRAGFAVVANEIQSLARRCTTVAVEATTWIEESARKSNHAGELCAKTKFNFKKIQAKARQLEAAIAEISRAAHGNSVSVSHVKTSVAQIHKTAQINMASAEETASASKTLNHEAEAMQETVARLQQLVSGSISGAGAVSTESPLATPPPATHAPAPVSNNRRAMPDHDVKNCAPLEKPTTVLAVGNSADK